MEFLNSRVNNVGQNNDFRKCPKLTTKILDHGVFSKNSCTNEKAIFYRFFTMLLVRKYLNQHFCY